ncbi:MAG: aspartate-semialdehyde dehydrogenase [Chloroflexi bacterium]|nr:aspartate-semialdehyde dehydrogenase [Chloroflexota bacterium]
MTKQLRVGIVGATGAVGQRFVQLLDGHPWFTITALAASDRSAGRTYQEATRWILNTPMPPSIAEQQVLPATAEALSGSCDIIFSALPARTARDLEPQLAAAGFPVFSNASALRMEPDVPLMIPEVNPDHLALVRVQQKRRGWKGYVVTNPNCSTIHLVLALKPLQDAFGLDKVMVTTLQALSGAGYPGVPSLDIIDNVIPYIRNEEGKIESEPLKLLGQYTGQGIDFADIRISAAAHRVAVVDGHLEAVVVQFKRRATLEEVREALRTFRSVPQELNLPTAPDPVIVLREEEDRPQPRLDRDAGRGMATTVGRLRPDPILDYKFVLLGHNTIRGAAGASILNAELALATGYL